MAKFVYAVLTVFAIEMAIWLFAGASYSQSSLFGLIANPNNFLSNPLYSSVILITLTAFAASAIIPLNTYQINIYALYAGVAVVLISFSISIIHLWQFTNGQLTGILTESFSYWITAIIIAPIFVFYLIAVLEWVRSN